MRDTRGECRQFCGLVTTFLAAAFRYTVNFITNQCLWYGRLPLLRCAAYDSNGHDDGRHGVSVSEEREWVQPGCVLFLTSLCVDFFYLWGFSIVAIRLSDNEISMFHLRTFHMGRVHPLCFNSATQEIQTVQELANSIAVWLRGQDHRPSTKTVNA